MSVFESASAQYEVWSRKDLKVLLASEIHHHGEGWLPCDADGITLLVTSLKRQLRLRFHL